MNGPRSEVGGASNMRFLMEGGLMDWPRLSGIVEDSGRPLWPVKVISLTGRTDVEVSEKKRYSRLATDPCDTVSDCFGTNVVDRECAAARDLTHTASAYGPSEELFAHSWLYE